MTTNTLSTLSLLCSIILSASCFSKSALAADQHVDQLSMNKDVLSHSGARFVSISPDGAHSAHLQRVNDKEFIIIRDNNSHTMTRINANQLAISQLHWINNSQLVFSTNGQLRMLDRNGHNYRVLLDNLNYNKADSKILIASHKRQFKNWSLINPLVDDDNHILVGAKDMNNEAYVYRLNINTHNLSLETNNKAAGVEQWIVANNGRVGFGVKRSKSRITFLANADSEWQDFNEANDNNLAFDGGSVLERRTVFQGLSNDPNIIYLSENLHTDRFRLVEYNMQSHTIEKVLAEDSRYDIGGDQHTQLAFDKFDGSLAGVHYQGLQPKTQWFDAELAALQDKIERQFPNEQHRIKQWSETKDQLMVESWDHAANASIYSVNSNTLQRLKVATLDTLAENLAPQQALQLPARDGYLLDAYLTLPKDMTSNAVPLVVIPHGGPWSRDVWRYDEEAQFFAQQGMATLKVNFRGSTGLGYEHIAAAIGEIDGLMIDDIADATRWALANGIASSDQVYVLGTSYGGYAALMSAVRYPDLYRAISANAAPLNIAKQFKHYKQSANDFAYNFWSEAVIDPKSDKKAIAEISPISYLKNMKQPFLLFHGTLDTIVPLSHIKEASRVAGKDHINIIEGEGHGFSLTENHRHFLETSANLFKAG